MSDEQPTLWDEPSRILGESDLEATVRAAIEEIADERPLVPAERAIARVCRALALNIDRGNAKGRAIANEAQQLTALLNQLGGLDAEQPAGSTIDSEIKDLLDAFTAPAAARPDPAPAGNDGT